MGHEFRNRLSSNHQVSHVPVCSNLVSVHLPDLHVFASFLYYASTHQSEWSGQSVLDKSERHGPDLPVSGCSSVGSRLMCLENPSEASWLLQNSPPLPTICLSSSAGAWSSNSRHTMLRVPLILVIFSLNDDVVYLNGLFNAFRDFAFPRGIGTANSLFPIYSTRTQFSYSGCLYARLFNFVVVTSWLSASLPIASL